MEAAFQGEFFPVVEEKLGHKPKWRAWMDAVAQVGWLLPRSSVPMVVDLSRQRVHQLIEEGKLNTVWVNGHEFIGVAELERFLSLERKSGRPVKELTLGDSYRRHLLKS